MTRKISLKIKFFQLYGFPNGKDIDEVETDHPSSNDEKEIEDESTTSEKNMQERKRETEMETDIEPLTKKMRT